jgi:hypothetical protein
VWVRRSGDQATVRSEKWEITCEISFPFPTTGIKNFYSRRLPVALLSMPAFTAPWSRHFSSLRRYKFPLTFLAFRQRVLPQSSGGLLSRSGIPLIQATALMDLTTRSENIYRSGCLTQLSIAQREHQLSRIHLIPNPRPFFSAAYSFGRPQLLLFCVVSDLPSTVAQSNRGSNHCNRPSSTSIWKATVSLYQGRLKGSREIKCRSGSYSGELHC